MEKEFNFVLSNNVNGSDDGVVFKAFKITETGIYRISWNDDENFNLYLPEHVKSHLDTGRWIKLG